MTWVIGLGEVGSRLAINLFKHLPRRFFFSSGVAKCVLILDKDDEFRTLPEHQDKRLVVTQIKANETVRRLLLNHADRDTENRIDVLFLHSLMDLRAIDLLKSISSIYASRTTCVAMFPLSVGMGPTVFPHAHQVLNELPDYCGGFIIFDSDEHLRDWKSFEGVFSAVVRLLKHIVQSEEQYSMLHTVIFSEDKVGLLKVSPCPTVSVPNDAEFGIISRSVGLGLGQPGKKASSRFIRAFEEEGMMIVGGRKLKENLRKALLL